MKSVLIWRIFKILCLLLVIIQTYLSITSKFFSDKTTTTTTSNKLDSMEFPVLVYIVPKPGLDAVNLTLQGYEGAYPYFLGRKNQPSNFGWAAASKTVKGILNLMGNQGQNQKSELKEL